VFCVPPQSGQHLRHVRRLLRPQRVEPRLALEGAMTATKWSPDVEIVALRYVLALTRHDRDAAEHVRRDMANFAPGLLVGVLACIAMDFAKALGHGSDDGAAAVIEGWIQAVLDDHDGTDQ
jgi:hypothetical protein